jgi:hypothetical protein
VLYEHENVSPSQKFVPYCLSSFPNDEQYNQIHYSIQDIRNIFKRKATWDEPIEKAQLLKPNSK